MPKTGEKFINAVGVEVVAHGGSTPAVPGPSNARNPDQPINVGNVNVDVYGREYDPRVPVFIPTGTNLVFDRLQNGPASLVDIDTLNAEAVRRGHGWNATEHGIPSQSWLDANALPIDPQEGYGTGTPPELPILPPETGTIISGRMTVGDLTVSVTRTGYDNRTNGDGAIGDWEEITPILSTLDFCFYHTQNKTLYFGDDVSGQFGLTTDPIKIEIEGAPVLSDELVWTGATNKYWAGQNTEKTKILGEWLKAQIGRTLIVRAGQGFS